MNEEQIIEKILLNINQSNYTIRREFKIGKSIADLVLISNSFGNDFVTVYEVKSEYDTLKRLKSQIENYSKFADKLVVVVAKKHLEESIKIVGGTGGGVKLINEQNELELIMHPANLRFNWRFDTIFKLLRKPEYLAITKQYYGYVPDVPNTQIYRKCFEMLKEIPLYHFRKDVITRIRMRNL